VVEPHEGDLAAARNPTTRFRPDHSKSAITENDSPDVGFRFSLNPYRGCEHGCSYCYARPTHEYLGSDAGLGFETDILVKHDAPGCSGSSWPGRGGSRNPSPCPG
jgi:DNA repair photolyase